MKKRRYKVTMICREIWRATIFIEPRSGVNLEQVKDEAWAEFDEKKSKDLEQENFTKIDYVED